MFSGKTEELLRRIRRAQFANQKIEIFKPAVDTRYDEEAVVSHDESSIMSTPVHNSAEILLYVNMESVEVVAIDEVQFFDDGIVLDGLSEQMWYDFKTKKFYSSNEEEIARKIDKLCLKELDDLLSATLPFVQDEKDRGMILQIQDSIHSESHENLNYRYTHAYLKIAHENLIKAWYSYKTDSILHINLFILMEDSSLLMDISRGGDKKAMEEKGLTTYDFDPSRYYRFYPKTGEFSSGDFYWE